ncbi:putative pectin lyase A [Ceratocystis fimbriata CBS 114723]|uniref:pectin lyase n=1 Tax=Ceratocystis fimbriata CBS 114723 TaxID=1035309 RepID=A0A2C5XES0_9PEZI|nr:putative pectin lyase A [Ceratocystis fimbriata CBS 114723]
MKFTIALVAIVKTVAAVTVSGAAEGFASGVTGGGYGNTVYPKTNDELVAYLGSADALNIVLTKTFDFTDSEGTVTGSGCAPWGTGSACQVAINKDNWCDNYQADAPKVSVTYKKAGQLGITVGSNKSIIGQGTTGVIKGKGLRIVKQKNVIIQNVHITGLNPQYVWGGDAITLNGADLIWIDHVKTSLIGRQHIVLGNDASNRVTISNSEIDGQTSWSATCDGHHYWSMYFTGSNDLITLKNNYVHHTSGRAPKVAGNTLLHAVNNYWSDNTGQAFEADAGSNILIEGNVFQNIKNIAKVSSGKIFSSPDATSNKACAAALGRNCELNSYTSSGTLSTKDTSFLSNFGGKKVAAAAAVSTVSGVKSSAGFGKIY